MGARTSGLGLLWVVFLCLAVGGVPGQARAMNAQAVFAKTKASVVVVVGYDSYKRPKKIGSGFFIDDGHTVVTNHHVIEKMATIKIKLIDRTLVDVVKVLGVDKSNDLALLKVDRAGTPLVLAPQAAKVGQDIIAIGNPKGLERTLSTGIVSGIRHSGLFKKGTKAAVYQITAPISHGSSGGPVLNSAGQVIGVSTFGVEDGQNLNFAVPSLYVKKLLDGGSSGGRCTTPDSGVGIRKDDSGAIHIFQKKKK